MEGMETLPRTAWEPITPRGVATFARASVGRLWIVQSVVAVLVAGAIVWLLFDGGCSTVEKAIRNLPVTGEIRSGRLNWPEEPPRLLAEGRFLAFSVDLERAGDIRSPAHLQVEFGRDGLLFRSLFGYYDVRYPAGWVLAMNRTELQAWWGAWMPWLLLVAALGVIAGLMLMWMVLATLYAGPVWLMAFYANRNLDLMGSWKLCGAAMLPGAVLMAGAILFYDLAVLDLVMLMVVMGGHWLVGWVYLPVSLWFLPTDPETAAHRKNPFAPSPG